MPIAAKAAPIHSGIGTNAGAEFFAGAAYYKTDTNKRLFRAGKDTNMNKEAAEKALVQARHRLEEAQVCVKYLLADALPIQDRHM